MFGEKAIVDKFMGNVALIDNLLGRDKGKLINRQDIENRKSTLYHVYGYKDIYKVAPEVIDEDKFYKILNTVFTYYDQPKPEIPQPTK